MLGELGDPGITSVLVEQFINLLDYHLVAFKVITAVVSAIKVKVI